MLLWVVTPSIRPHGVTIQKTNIDIFNYARTLNPVQQTMNFFCLLIEDTYIIRLHFGPVRENRNGETID
jgi:hypothetical protein